jgi:hypothetical protein
MFNIFNIILKKYNRQSILSIVFLFNYLLLNAESFNSVDINDSVKMFYLQKIERDSFKKACFINFIEKSKYIEMISFVNEYSNKGLITDFVKYSNLSLCYYKIGNKDSFLKYIELAIDIENTNTRIYNDEISIFFTDDCLYFYPMCEDSILIEKYKLNDIEYYKSKKYPLAEVGIKILNLGFDDQFLRKKIEYNELYGLNSNYYWLLDSIKSNKYIDILKDYGFLSKTQIGKILLNQRLMCWHITDKIIRDKVIIPNLEKAYNLNYINANTLIAHIIRSKFLEGDIEIGSLHFNNLIKELCSKYNYVNNFIYMP